MKSDNHVPQAYALPFTSKMMRAYASSFLAYGQPSDVTWVSRRIRLQPRYGKLPAGLAQYLSDALQVLENYLCPEDIMAMRFAPYYPDYTRSYLNLIVLVPETSMLAEDTNGHLYVRWEYDDVLIMDLTDNMEPQFRNNTFIASPNYLVSGLYGNRPTLETRASQEEKDFLYHNSSRYVKQFKATTMKEVIRLVENEKHTRYSVRYDRDDDFYYLEFTCFENNKNYELLLNDILESGYVLTKDTLLFDYLDRSRKLKCCLDNPERIQSNLMGRDGKIQSHLNRILNVIASHPDSTTDDYLDLMLHYLLHKECVA